jgi:ElaB/YqjD/DUF883 family membrane-anchored ribosome-binding protein
MSEFNNGTSSTTGHAAAAAAGGIQEQASEAASRAKSKFESARQPVADRLHTAADKVRGAAGSAADKLEQSADYIESRDARRMLTDLVAVIKRHPAQSLVVAGVVGFLIARAFRNKD